MKLAFVLMLLPIAICASASAANAVPRIVVLTESGETREGLPRLLLHPDGAAIAKRLDRGAARDLVSVWLMLQSRREGVAAVEPAYLLLSNRQGGFARYGFYLDGVKKSGTPFIDVHKDWELSGRLGAVDQIFPHELAHAMFHELGVLPPPGRRANQVHAVAVRTDRFTAFNEGFAEHLQLIAVEHPQALPETKGLADAYEDAGLARKLASYRAEMTARFAPATRLRMTFPLWYSGAERMLRYAAVKRNDFARDVVLADHLFTGRSRLRAYLLENTLPGDEGGARKPLARLVATEGVVASFFYRWATDESLRGRRRDDAFYAAYGTTADAVTPLQNVYLKLFHVLETRRPRNVLELASAYGEAFPDEEPLVDAVVLKVFGVPARQSLPAEIWLAGEFETGTTIFDQFRGAPRVHTFDLNAASVLDLATVDGVTPEVARAIRAAAPYASIEDVSRVSAAPRGVVAAMMAMSHRMNALDEGFDEEALSLSGILLPFLWRTLAVLLIAGVAGALLYAGVRRRYGLPASVLRTLFSGAGAAFAVVLAAWVLGSGIAAAVAAVALFGLPAGIVILPRDPRAAVGTLVARAASVVPALVMTTAWF